MEVKDYEYRKNSNKNRIAFTCEQLRGLWKVVDIFKKFTVKETF